MTITLHDMDVLDAQLAEHDCLMSKAEYDSFAEAEARWLDEKFSFEQFIEDSLVKYHREYDEYGA